MGGATDRVAGACANARGAVEAAERAFPGWSATPAAERRKLLQRARDLLVERQADIAALVTEETRATLSWGTFNMRLGAEHLGYAASHAGAATTETIPSHIAGKRAQAVRQPVGVVGIAPWNAPVILRVRAVAAPLAYGNTVVFKASEQCPRTHAAIVDALRDGGVPADAIRLVTHDRVDAAVVVEELIAHPRVRRIIAELAARHLQRVLLELGGKTPLVVPADADPQECDLTLFSLARPRQSAVSDASLTRKNNSVWGEGHVRELRAVSCGCRSTARRATARRQANTTRRDRMQHEPEHSDRGQDHL